MKSDDATKPKKEETTTAAAKESKIPESKHLKGDGLRLKMHTNDESLWIEGDGCHVKLHANRGLLRVTGDGCRINVERNIGKIECIGDGGRVQLGSESDVENVVYRGDGGIIEVTTKNGDVVKTNHDNNKVTRRTCVRSGKQLVVTTTTTSVDNKDDRKMSVHAGGNAGTRVCINFNGVNRMCASLRR